MILPYSGTICLARTYDWWPNIAYSLPCLYQKHSAVSRIRHLRPFACSFFNKTFFNRIGFKAHNRCIWRILCLSTQYYKHSPPIRLWRYWCSCMLKLPHIYLNLCVWQIYVSSVLKRHMKSTAHNKRNLKSIAQETDLDEKISKQCGYAVWKQHCFTSLLTRWWSVESKLSLYGKSIWSTWMRRKLWISVYLS